MTGIMHIVYQAQDHCPEPSTFVILLQATLMLTASLQRGKQASGVSHSLKLRLMNGTQVCLAPGLSVAS